MAAGPDSPPFDSASCIASMPSSVRYTERSIGVNVRSSTPTTTNGWASWLEVPMSTMPCVTTTSEPTW
jgi:hypothetical protein